MPRLDPKLNKVDAFRESVGEDVGKYEQSNNSDSSPDNQQVIEDNGKSTQSTIDFSPYLREPKYTLEDVILPKTTREQVSSILAELEHQDLIYQKWGMGEKHKLDRALSINFSGAPGTGKTITAEALAHALKLQIVDVPYQLLESKFVGETPKNIAKAFEFATEKNAVLFFDEADSFLGKRLESVTQSTDTAVNLTRSVMLKQFSEYKGIVVFATNLVRNYDSAFISRIRWKIQFDLPDEEARVKIWQVQIPTKLPLCESVSFADLAKQFDAISGRDIKNAVFQAVVSAAKQDKPNEDKKVTQAHFAEAIAGIIEANKASEKTELTFKPVEGDVQLPNPPSPNDSANSETSE